MSARDILLNLLGNKCDVCGSTEYLSFHHKDRNRENNDLTNIRLLCRKHHLGLHNKRFKKGKKKVKCSISISAGLLNWIDRHYKAEGYSSRSHIIEVALSRLLESTEN